MEATPKILLANIWAGIVFWPICNLADNMPPSVALGQAMAMIAPLASGGWR